jgi:hypothetical protein
MVSFNLSVTPSSPDFKCSLQKEIEIAVSEYSNDTTLTLTFPVGTKAKIKDSDADYKRVFDIDVPDGASASFTISIIRLKTFQKGVLNIAVNTYPQDFTFNIVSYCVFMGLVINEEGYADVYRKKSETESINTYVRDTVAGSYYFDNVTGVMTTTNVGGITYSEQTSTMTYQTSSDYFEAYFDTVNIVYEKEAIQGNALEIFVKASTSLANCKISWASDSNMQFISEGKLALLGSLKETGSWNNDTVRYARTQEVLIKKLTVKARNQNSIKLRVEAKLKTGGIDDVNIHEINILPNGIFFIGGDYA